MRQLVYEDNPQNPREKGLLLINTYVDAIVTGAVSVEEILVRQNELIALLRLGEFELKKWASNCKAIY